MSKPIVINDLERTLSNTRGFLIAGFVQQTRTDLIQKLGDPLPGINSKYEKISQFLIPTVADVNDFWAMEFNDKIFATIYDNAMTVDPNDWYVAVNSLSAVKYVEEFLGVEVTPDQKHPVKPITDTYPTYIKSNLPVSPDTVSPAN
jgi:hypothetical protein